MDEKINMHAARFQTYLEKWGGKLFGLKSMHAREILRIFPESSLQKNKAAALTINIYDSCCLWMAGEMDICTAIYCIYIYIYIYIHGWGFNNDVSTSDNRTLTYSCSVME
jgi:hypothetical protein